MVHQNTIPNFVTENVTQTTNFSNKVYIYIYILTYIYIIFINIYFYPYSYLYVYIFIFIFSILRYKGTYRQVFAESLTFMGASLKELLVTFYCNIAFCSVLRYNVM